MDLMDYRRKIIANSPHLSSASGAVASFSDGADLSLKSLNVDIEPVQSGTGDPSPSNIRPISGWNAVNVKNGNTVIATISLGQTVYGGTLNPLTGVLTVDTRLLTLSSNGLGNYAYNSSNGQLRITALRAMPNTIVNICSHYKSFSGTFANLPDKSFMASSTTIAVKDTNFTSLSAWLTYLDAQVAANTPVQARVKLQTAEVIQLTPHQIRTLYGSNTIFADTGNIALEYWAHP